jgi:hypothetical protein
MRRQMVICDFCYRPAARTVVQQRRGLWQVIAGRPARRAEACRTARCLNGAADYVSGKVGAL